MVTLGTQPGRTAGRRGMRKRLLRVLRGAAILIAVFLAIFPLLWVFLASFKSATDLMRLPPVLFFRPTLENYFGVAHQGFFTYLRNSAVVTLSSVALSVALGIPAAFGLSRFAVPGRKTIMMAILSVRFMPYIVFALPMFLIMVQLGIIGTLGGLLFVYIIINLPVIIWLMRTFFDDIPRDIDEAAAIDGGLSGRDFLPSGAALCASGSGHGDHSLPDFRLERVPVVPVPVRAVCPDSHRGPDPLPRRDGNRRALGDVVGLVHRHHGPHRGPVPAGEQAAAQRVHQRPGTVVRSSGCLSWTPRGAARRLPAFLIHRFHSESGKQYSRIFPHWPSSLLDVASVRKSRFCVK